MDEWTIIDPDDRLTLPPRSGRYGIVYRQGRIVRRYVDDWDDYEERWKTGMRDVEILAWCELPPIPEELKP